MKTIHLYLTAFIVTLLSLQTHVFAEQSTTNKTAPAIRSITMTNIEYEGTKVWLPGVIVAKKGERVQLKLINKAPSGAHGFAIPAFKVEVVVPKATEETPFTTIEFVASESGLFPFFCHMHAAHVGGQVLILDK